MARKAAIALVALPALALLVATPAVAKKRKPGIYVKPGPNAIAKAIDRAKPGQTIRVRRGRYREALVIEKPLRLVAAGRVRPVIDGGCATQFTIAVRSPGVVLRRLKVIGADESFGPSAAEVDFNGVTRGKARGLVVGDSCDAEYGINVFDTGPVQILRNRARGGFSDTGIYIGGITDTFSGALRVRRNVSYGNNRGLIVEDTLAHTDVRVTANRLFANRLPSSLGPPSGLFLSRTDGILVYANSVEGNGAFGIHLNPESDFNRLYNNVSRSNPTNFLDEGAGNCGSQNSFAVPPCQP